MTHEELSTKEKILHISHKLFSEKGVNAVSVREIAKEADVNVAAVNYHFGNKENLYAETIKASMTKTKNDVENIYLSLGTDASIMKLSERIYDYFVENKEDLITGFKLFLTIGNEIKVQWYDYDEQEVGPPGGIYIYKTLKNEAPHASDKDIKWGVRTIFSQLLHKAMLICNHGEIIKRKYHLDADDFKQDTLRLVKIVVQEVKQSS